MSTNETVQYISAVYETHAAKLRRYLLSKDKNADLIEDIIQDSFLKLQIELQKGKVITNVNAWLHKVSFNSLMDHYRKTISDSLSTLTENQKIDNEEQCDHRPEDCLKGIVAKLPYQYKKAVYLVDIKGMKQQEAADELKLALPTLKSHVQRGRKLVMKGYMDCCDYTLNDAGVLVGENKTKKECKVCH